jgi:dipeptide/tripeptide permease
VPLTGLAAAGIGKGLATPVNSALLGDESADLPCNVRSAMFARFYLFICAGSFATKFATPYVRSHVAGTNFVAFCMLGGVVILAMTFFATAGSVFFVSFCA